MSDRVLTVTWPKLVGGRLDRQPLPALARHGRRPRIVLPYVPSAPRSYLGRTAPLLVDDPSFHNQAYVRTRLRLPDSPARLSYWRAEEITPDEARRILWEEFVLAVGRGAFE